MQGWCIGLRNLNLCVHIIGPNYNFIGCVSYKNVCVLLIASAVACSLARWQMEYSCSYFWFPNDDSTVNQICINYNRWHHNYEWYVKLNI